MLNTILIAGRSGHDAEVKGNEGNRFCVLRLASTDDFGRTCWIDVSVFQRTPQAFENAMNVKRGEAVKVIGRLAMREWEDRGAKRNQHSIVAEAVEQTQDASTDLVSVLTSALSEAQAASTAVAA